MKQDKGEQSRVVQRWGMLFHSTGSGKASDMETIEQRAKGKRKVPSKQWKYQALTPEAVLGPSQAVVGGRMAGNEIWT